MGQPQNISLEGQSVPPNRRRHSLVTAADSLRIAISLDTMSPPHHAAVLKDLFWTLYSKLAAVLEGHRVVYEVARWIPSVCNSRLVLGADISVVIIETQTGPKLSRIFLSPRSGDQCNKKSAVSCTCTYPTMDQTRSSTDIKYPLLTRSYGMVNRTETVKGQVISCAG